MGGVQSESWNHFSFFFVGVLGDFVLVVTFVGVLQLASLSHMGVDGGIGLVGVRYSSLFFCFGVLGTTCIVE
jgi:hypothetical protein